MADPKEKTKPAVKTREPKKVTHGTFDNLRQLPHPVEELLGLTPDPSASQTRSSAEPVSDLNPSTRPPRTRSSTEPVRHTDGFTGIINHLLDDILPTLDPAEQVVLLRIYRLTHGHGNATCKVSRQKLVNKTGVKRTRLLQALSKLEERGFIKRLADDTSNTDIYNRGMSFQILLEGVKPVRTANPSDIRTRSSDEPNKVNTLKENTQTQDVPSAGVRVGSKFTIEECRRYAESLRNAGIKNPGGYATTIHRTGEADTLIESFLSPTAVSSTPDVSRCPDCHGSGFKKSVTGAGVTKCNHTNLQNGNATT
jgi:DNA-binding MarR family transcriptional regulator